MQIFTVSALAGAAKTYNAIRVATAGVRAGEKYLFCVPSTDLASQIEVDCTKVGCSAVTAIHSEDGKDGSVVARLTRHFQNADPYRGELLILTMAALERLKYIERRASWHLIVDELPSPVCHLPISLHENRHHLLDLVTERPWNAAYSMLVASEAGTYHVVDVARNRWSDIITQQVSEVANKLLSSHWHCFALNDQLARFKAPADGPNTLDFFGLLQPSIFEGFKTCTLMGACLEESLLYRHWLSLGVDFVPHPTIKPRFTQHPNGGLVTIQYAIDRDWSARLRDTGAVLDNITHRCKAALNGEKYVYLANKGFDHPALADGVRLPHVSHGLNNFRAYHNAMLLSALNPPPAYFGLCSDMIGLDGDDVRTAIYRTSVYQAAMRISIRDQKDLSPKRIQVVDKATAIWLGDLIANSKIEKLPGNDPAPADRRRVCQPKTTAERWNNHRQRIRQELIAGLDYVNNVNILPLHNPTNDMLYIEDTVSRNFHVGTIFRGKFAKIGIDTYGLSVASFRTLLGELHSRVIRAKDYNELGCSCMFDPDLDGDTSRGNVNIISVSGIWLDNDGGDLSPKDFAKMLNVPMVIYNSFSSTVKLPKWRVWIPTSHLITPAVHKELVAQIKKMLIDRKYYGAGYIKKHPDLKVKHHGFDESKLTQAVLFYLPCQAAAGPAASFLDEYHWDAAALNPYEWIDRSITAHRPPTIPRALQTSSEAPQAVNEEKIAKANENWSAHGANTGNRAFFQLAVAYRHAGFSWYDAEPLLRQQAHYAAHGAKSVAHRLADLKQYGRKIWQS
jgi:hypothetical protein